ncbi:MAG: DHA2 family efflux MFS transporter permease subunit [Rhizobiaceae bacterium]|nr:MAG: DHA2 family efflux MFS transporter permease subunit [Rhizobiaceae bacterium]
MTETAVEPSSRRGTPNFRVTALIVASAMIMEQLDATVLATALPSMAKDFAVSAPQMSVVLTSYLLSLALFIPASGWLADRFGARLIFRLAIAIFTVGSVLCGQSPSLSFLVFSRLLQGFGGAMMVPVGRLVLLRTTAKSDYVSAMSWMLVPALIGPIIGPPLGGFIVSYLDWRWIFYINVPIGALGIALVTLFIEDVREEAVERFDFVGLVFSGISLGCLLFGFETASHSGEGRLAALLIACGVVFGLFYLHHAKVAEAPILDLSLMKIRTFGLSVIGGSLTRITQGALPFLLPLMMQIGFGLSALESGLITFATAIGSLAMKAAAAGILRRFGFRNVLIVNGVLGAGSYAICAAFRPYWPEWAIYAVLIVSGFFMSLQFTAYNIVAYDEIPRPRMSSATSFYTTFQQLMLSLGICVAALTLHGSMLMAGRGHAALGDFSVAFLVVTAVSLSATWWNAKLPPEAGSDMSGHKAIRRPPANEKAVRRGQIRPV